MYAVVEIYGKQYKIQKGESIKVDYFPLKIGESVVFEKILLIGGDSLKIGSPYIAGASVKARVKEDVRDKKIIVFKYKPKKDYRRTKGHRQMHKIITIEEIVT